ncbi:30S ribosomal protein S12 methylthiotransferase RimO [bacterium]|nr:30S ribosomal protein S12 methylthiotransferase RimO [bacterium]
MQNNPLRQIFFCMEEKPKQFGPVPYQDKRFCLITLGCPKNQVDSEVLAGQLTMHGIQLVDDAKDADVILINTCGFIEDAKQESIDAILEAIQFKSRFNKKEVYVWGCLSQRYAGTIANEIPEVDGYFGVEAFEPMGKYFLGPTFRVTPHIHAKRVLTTPPHVAYLKIADGCDHKCTFCAIPLFKGPYRSRSMAGLLQEAESLAKNGVKELILIAQDTTRYGSDLNGKETLVSLLNHLSDIQGIEWLRIMYTHPDHVNEALIEAMSGEEKICSYLDMPLQHIADPVLKAMGRGSNRASIERLINTLRDRVSGIILRSAFIVGFPNETDEYFQELLAFVKNTKFERMGAFIYSPEEGTRAFPMGNPVSRRSSEMRYALLMETQQEISESLNLKLEGTVQSVIIDEYDHQQNLYIGRTRGDCLEIDQAVWVEGETNIGDIVQVCIQESGPYDLWGSIL